MLWGLTLCRSFDKSKLLSAIWAHAAGGSFGKLVALEVALGPIVPVSAMLAVKVVAVVGELPSSFLSSRSNLTKTD